MASLKVVRTYDKLFLGDGIRTEGHPDMFNHDNGRYYDEYLTLNGEQLVHTHYMNKKNQAEFRDGTFLGSDNPDYNIFLMAGVKVMSISELQDRKQPGYRPDEEADRRARNLLAAEVPVYKEWLLQRSPEAERRIAREVLLLTRKYGIVVLKAVAGLLRLLFEDLINVFVQGAVLVKYWYDYSTYMRTFTLASLVAGVTCSAAGPLKDLWSTRALRQAAAAMGHTGELSIEPGEQVEPSTGHEERTPYRRLQDEEDPAAPNPEGEEENPEARNSEGGEEDTAVRDSAGDQGQQTTNKSWRRVGSKKRRGWRPYEGSVLDFLANTQQEHSIAAHRLLLFAACLYWGSMASLPVIFNVSVKGGRNASIPPTAILYFTIMVIVTMLIELWVALHTKRGLRLMRNWGETLLQACSCEFAEAATICSIFLSTMARYDTFCDVMMTLVLWKGAEEGEEITYIYFNHTLHQHVYFPMPLHKLSLFSLVVGVFLLQGVPGILLMCSKKYLAAAFKLNEFNFLLGLVENETEATHENEAEESEWE